MSTSPVGVGRVPTTAPLDPLAGTFTKPDKGTADKQPDAFGADGGTTHCYSGSGDVNTCDFADVPTTPTDSLPGQWIAKVDVALTTHGASVTQADGALTTAATGPETTNTDKKRTGLTTAQTAVEGSLTTVRTMACELDEFLKTLPADHPQRAELETKLGQLQDQQATLETKLTDLGNRITAFDDAVNQRESNADKRSDNLGDITDLLNDPAKTPKEKADAIGNLITKFAANGALTSTVTLLKDVQHCLRGETDKDGKAITIADLENRAAALKDPAKLRNSEHAALTRIVAAAKTAMTSAAQTAPAYTPSAHTGFSVPDVPKYAAASDADDVNRNRKITQTYRDLEVAMKAYLGTSMDTWLSMGANASAECGKQLANDKVDDAMTMVQHPVEAFNYLINPDADTDDFWPALRAGNREIYNTIGPAMQIFLAAESKGQDGVAALLASDHYKTYLMANADHPSYKETGPLIDALKSLQQAAKTTDPKAKADLIFQSIKGIAVYEQKSVLQPIIGNPGDGAYETMKEVSPIMAWTPPGTDSEVKLLPNGGNWADYNTRINAIVTGPAAWFDRQNRTKSY